MYRGETAGCNFSVQKRQNQSSIDSAAAQASSLIEAKYARNHATKFAKSIHYILTADKFDERCPNSSKSRSMIVEI